GVGGEKQVLGGLVGLLTSLALVFAMVAPTKYPGLHLLYLPVPLLALLLFCLAIVWVLSAVAVVVPDIAQIVNIALLLFMFILPIGDAVGMVPSPARVFWFLNPLTYLFEAVRFAIMGQRVSPGWVDAVFLVCALGAAAAAGAFFRRMSPVFSDYE